VIRIGTAGWQVPRAVRDSFPADGSTLQRYAAVFNCVEINTSFYRPHRPQTYERWAAATPPGFRFSVKLPKAATHEQRLVGTGPVLDRFFAEIRGLGDKLGPVLVQTPGKLAFEPVVAEAFFSELRNRFDGEVVCEPRGPSWFGSEAALLLDAYGVARVAADPAPVPEAALPIGRPRYWRLHGSPRPYWSSYPQTTLNKISEVLATTDWCIFDNTASGSAASDALALLEKVKIRP
jgi:uncharacterized protein YecE (DUF72 family)